MKSGIPRGSTRTIQRACARAMQRFFRIIASLRQAGREFGRDDCATQAAALAYYALFSIPPIVLIAILVAGRFWGTEAALENLKDQLIEILGPSGAELVLSSLHAGQNLHGSLIATVISSVVLLVGASGVMLQFQSALNHVWNCPPVSSGLRSLILKRFFSFLMVLAVASLLLISLLATTLLTAMVTWLAPYLPNQSGSWLRHFGNMSITLVLIILLLAGLFRWMPDCRVLWRDVWGGALMTAVLFMLGKELLGWYLGTVNLIGYGGAGALVLLLMWIYYTSWILLFGAEFTQVWAQGRGHQKASAAPETCAPTRNKTL